ncbi:MAG TPA: SRPBCC family protein [Candidatus Limnocylindria bacterium]|nr:SRPBCC family protein [Candidatus Limnocylindria bacterium]
MKLAHTATIPVAPERVWAVVMDIPVAARCVPGVAAVTSTGPERYKGSLLVQIGPVRLILDGDIAITSRDDAARHASLRADAKDTRLGGTVRATVDILLRDAPGGCELRIESDVQIGGRIGEFGQPVIQRKADQLLGQFAQCLARSAT